MLLSIDEFLWALRRDGFAVSTAQAIDVARACALVGFGDRARLRDAIGAVVVERAADLRRYNAAFDRFFSPEGAHVGDLWARLRERGFAEGELSALRDLLTAAAERSGAFGDAIGFQALAGAAGELDQALRSAGIARVLAPMTSSLQVGFFAQRVMDQLGVPAVASALRRIRSALEEALGEDRGRALAEALAGEMERMRHRVREHVMVALRRLEGEEPAALGRMDVPFASLGEGEVDEVRRAVRALSERLRGAERVRRRRARRGRIDPHRTLRRSLQTGGVPFQPARRARRRDRPRLMVLCDVSDSVRVAARFMLEFVCAAQELFDRTRSFVFVSELAETTELFAALPTSSALERIQRGEVVSRAHNSNYGRVLNAFEERYGRDVDRRVTLVILGDGRTNYFADEAEVVRRLRDRARALLWLCPEGPGAWGTGDSAMLRYAAASTKVLVARTARELESAAREVVARRA
ncbi:VWA domain-containing protein [Sorangium sp. So ce1078]|uniref:VWA domain-containing protein n=1 Tax=Sorangium sp. So ce1078 TaxID=3133329 RepID=UPI003F646E6A